MLWRLYCMDDRRPGLGVALRTTLAQLEMSVAPQDLYVSPITYRHYHEGSAFNDERDSFMHKRKGFFAEHELRLLYADIIAAGVPERFVEILRRPDDPSNEGETR